MRFSADRKSGAAIKYLVAVLWGVLMILMEVAVVAWMIEGEIISMETLPYAVAAIMLVASFASSLIAISGNQVPWKAVLIQGVGLMLSLLLGNLILGIGQVRGVLPGVLPIVAGCGSALLLSKRPKKSKTYARRK